jgi:hypothetical protein
MPSKEIEEFARLLVKQVRDRAIRSCDIRLDPEARSVAAQRWRALGASPSEIRTVVPDIIDEAVFSFLNAIDQGMLPLKFSSSTGREVDLAAEGDGELGGWYMGSGGWRAMFSDERFIDDFADLAE